MPSTDRSKALAYGNLVSTKNKRVQPDNYGTTTVTNRFENPVSADAENSPEAQELRNEQQKIQNDGDRDNIDKTSFTPGHKTGRTVTPQTVTTSKETVHSLKGSFAKTWTGSESYNIAFITHPMKSSFTPSLNAFYFVLHEMELRLHGNVKLRQKCPYYFSLPIRLYYAIIIIVQIYRAKEVARTITKPESSWLRSFFRAFKDVSLPIAGPLVPILSNIVAHKPDDAQFDFVTPTINPHGTYESEWNPTTETSAVTVHPSHFLIPSPLILGSMLKSFCTAPRITNSMFTDNGDYAPFQLSTGGDLGGIRFPPSSPENPLSRPFAQILFNPAISHPLPEDIENMKEIHSFYKRTNFSSFPDPLPTDGVESKGPLDFTGIGDQLDWFQEAMTLAYIQSQFFED